MISRIFRIILFLASAKLVTLRAGRQPAEMPVPTLYTVLDRIKECQFSVTTTAVDDDTTFSPAILAAIASFLTEISHPIMIYTDEYEFRWRRQKKFRHHDRLCTFYLHIYPKTEFRLDSPYSNEAIFKRVKQDVDVVALLVTEHATELLQGERNRGGRGDSLCKHPPQYFIFSCIFKTGSQKDFRTRMGTIKAEITSKEIYIHRFIFVKSYCPRHARLCLVQLDWDTELRYHWMSPEKLLQYTRNLRKNFHSAPISAELEAYPLRINGRRFDRESRSVKRLRDFHKDTTRTIMMPMTIVNMIADRLNFTPHAVTVHDRPSWRRCARRQISLASELTYHDRSELKVMWDVAQFSILYSVPPANIGLSCLTELTAPMSRISWIALSTAVVSVTVVLTLSGRLGVSRSVLIAMRAIMNQGNVLSMSEDERKQKHTLFYVIYSMWTISGVIIVAYYSAKLEGHVIRPVTHGSQKSFSQLAEENYHFKVFEPGLIHMKELLEQVQNDTKHSGWDLDLPVAKMHQQLLLLSTEMNRGTAQGLREAYSKDDVAALEKPDFIKILAPILPLYFKKEYYTAKDEFFKFPTVASFLLPSADLPHGYFKMLVTTGIHDYFMKLKFTHRKRVEVAKFHNVLKNETEVKQYEFFVNSGGGTKVRLRDPLARAAGYVYFFGLALALFVFGMGWANYARKAVQLMRFMQNFGFFLNEISSPNEQAIAERKISLKLVDLEAENKVEVWIIATKEKGLKQSLN